MAPLLDLLGDLLAEQPIDELGVLAESRGVGLVNGHAVEAEPVDVRPEALFLAGRDRDRLTVDRRVERAVLGADRHEALARDVPAEQQHVGLVHLCRGEELAKAAVRAVDVGGEEDPQRAPARRFAPAQRHSGGSSRMAMLRSSWLFCLRMWLAIA